MKSLTLFRHAKTERDSTTGRDFDRRLMERGQRDSERMGQEIGELGLEYDLVLSSPAARAVLNRGSDRLDLGANLAPLFAKPFDLKLHS